MRDVTLGPVPVLEMSAVLSTTHFKSIHHRQRLKSLTDDRCFVPGSVSQVHIDDNAVHVLNHILKLRYQKVATTEILGNIKRARKSQRDVRRRSVNDTITPFSLPTFDAMAIKKSFKSRPLAARADFLRL